MRTRKRYLPLHEVDAGMMLGARIRIPHRGTQRYTLPAGHVLTEDNLFQLGRHRAEFIFIEEADTRPAEQIAEDTAQAARRVMEIFAGADLGDPVMARLFDQVLRFRSA